MTTGSLPVSTLNLEDTSELVARPDLGPDTFIHPRTQAIYLALGDGTFERTETTVHQMRSGDFLENPNSDFPTERPRGIPKYGVDLSREGYARY